VVVAWQWLRAVCVNKEYRVSKCVYIIHSILSLSLSRHLRQEDAHINLYYEGVMKAMAAQVVMLSSNDLEVVNVLRDLSLGIVVFVSRNKVLTYIQYVLAPSPFT
jgi:rRNA maturation endonuclease Nob1